jgi:hypothetical protein
MRKVTIIYQTPKGDRRIQFSYPKHWNGITLGRQLDAAFEVAKKEIGATGWAQAPNCGY